MPLYDFQCPSCARGWEGIARWDTDVECACGQIAQRCMSVPTVQRELDPYYDNGLGVRVESRSHRRDVMRSKSLVENDKPVVPHGARGTVFSFPGQATSSVQPSGAYARKRA